MRHNKYILLALKEAKRNIRYQHNIGAVLVRGGSVLSKASNIYENGLHAEMRCILGSKSDKQGSIMYVARHMRSQIFGMAKPCSQCEKLIRDSGIKMVVFTTNDINNIQIWKL